VLVGRVGAGCGADERAALLSPPTAVRVEFTAVSATGLYASSAASAVHIAGAPGAGGLLLDNLILGDAYSWAGGGHAIAFEDGIPGGGGGVTVTNVLGARTKSGPLYWSGAINTTLNVSK